MFWYSWHMGVTNQTLEHLRLLVDLGCDRAQGFHFSPPLPLDRLLGWLDVAEDGLLELGEERARNRIPRSESARRL